MWTDIILGQWGGSNLTGYYQANILRSIGITTQSHLLVFNLAYYAQHSGAQPLAHLSATWSVGGSSSCSAASRCVAALLV